MLLSKRQSPAGPTLGSVPTWPRRPLLPLSPAHSWLRAFARAAPLLKTRTLPHWSALLSPSLPPPPSLPPVLCWVSSSRAPRPHPLYLEVIRASIILFVVFQNGIYHHLVFITGLFISFLSPHPQKKGYKFQEGRDLSAWSILYCAAVSLAVRIVHGSYEVLSKYFLNEICWRKVGILSI